MCWLCAFHCLSPLQLARRKDLFAVGEDQLAYLTQVPPGQKGSVALVVFSCFVRIINEISSTEGVWGVASPTSTPKPRLGEFPQRPAKLPKKNGPLWAKPRVESSCWNLTSYHDKRGKRVCDKKPRPVSSFNGFKNVRMTHFLMAKDAHVL